MTYYALTIRQPFASLIIHGIKQYETRSWPAPPKLIGGKLAIHAAKHSSLIRVGTRDEAEGRGLVRPDCGLPESILNRLPNYPLPLGEVLGIVTVVACLEITERLRDQVSPEEKAIGYWELSPNPWEHRYAWRLKVEEDFSGEFPLGEVTEVAAKGQQRLWQWQRMMRKIGGEK